jgi:hypothetical protein
MNDASGDVAMHKRFGKTTIGICLIFLLFFFNFIANFEGSTPPFVWAIDNNSEEKLKEWLQDKKLYWEANTKEDRSYTVGPVNSALFRGNFLCSCNEFKFVFKSCFCLFICLFIIYYFFFETLLFVVQSGF